MKRCAGIDAYVELFSRKRKKKLVVVFNEAGERKRSFGQSYSPSKSPVEANIVGQSSNPLTPQIPCPIYVTLQKNMRKRRQLLDNKPAA
jgi:hypothetical protein